jgi:hypothetical protein
MQTTKHFMKRSVLSLELHTPVGILDSFNNKTKKCIITELKTFETPGFSHYTNEVRCNSTYNLP